MVTHHPACAVVRCGELRAWCDCGGDNDMSNGEKMHTALIAAMKKGIVEHFELGWDGVAAAAYEGFIEDVRDDIRVTHAYIELDKETYRNPVDAEVKVVAYLSDEGDVPDISREVPLSEILSGLCDMEGAEETMRLLNNSIAAFKKKARIEG